MSFRTFSSFPGNAQVPPLMRPGSRTFVLIGTEAGLYNPPVCPVADPSPGLSTSTPLKLTVLLHVLAAVVGVVLLVLFHTYRLSDKVFIMLLAVVEPSPVKLSCTASGIP